MIKFSPLRRLTFLVIATLLTLGAVVGFILIPTIRAMTSLQRTITATHEHLELELVKAKHARRSLKELQNVLQTIAPYKNIMLGQGEEISLIPTLESLAQARDIESSFRITYDPFRQNNISFPI